MTTKALLGRVYNEVLEMHHHREIWKFLTEQLPQHGGDIVNSAITRWYVDAQAAAVRRIAGVRSQDKQSMVRLLTVVRKDLAKNPDLNREIEPSQIDVDIETLKKETALITRWADESVAHMGRTHSANPTFDQLDEAVDLLGEMLKKYYLLITGGYLARVQPVIQEDWRAPFRQPWL